MVRLAKMFFLFGVFWEGLHSRCPFFVLVKLSCLAPSPFDLAGVPKWTSIKVGLPNLDSDLDAVDKGVCMHALTKRENCPHALDIQRAKWSSPLPMQDDLCNIGLV